MSDDRKPVKSLAKGWASRTFSSAKVAASFGRVAAKQALNQARNILDEDDESGDFLADRLDEMKGLALKMGQSASFMDGGLPPKIREKLARLQSEARPMEWSAAEQVLQEAYGAGPDDVFEEFERTPFAAASIGQVHRARYAGRSVAVKLQYPGVSDTIGVDVGNIRKLSRFASLFTSVDGPAMVQELADRLREECDYRLEGANQQMFQRLFQDDRRVIIPGVEGPLCRKMVLVSDFAPGRTFQRFKEEAPQADRNSAGVLLFEFAMRAIFRHGVYNGDPHPGNYLFGEGQVAFLDYGCVRRFDQPFIDTWKRFARAILDNDFAQWKEAFTAAGFVGSPKFDYERQWHDIHHLYEPMLTPNFQFTPEYSEKSWRVLLRDSPNLLYTTMPPAWLFVNRLQWGLYTILGHLHAQGDFRGVFRSVVDGPIELAIPVEPVGV